MVVSRLQVAIKADPIKPDQVVGVRDMAAAILIAPSAAVGRVSRRRQTGFRPVRDNANMQAGLAPTAVLRGWAVTRRRYQAHRTET